MCKETLLHHLENIWNKLSNDTYRGRFAPAPTGNLHLGSLVAALASYFQARANNGEWLLRIEDLDYPRCIPGADTKIIAELRRFGMESDQPVVYQNKPEQQAHYQKAINTLLSNGLCYPCVCSRKTLSQLTTYPQTCAHLSWPCEHPHSIRIKSPPGDYTFEDIIQGRQQQNIEHQGGDFIVKRKDLLVAYQLAVVVDDAKQGITEVVRGYDILSSTAKQLYLFEKLELTAPQYAHLPVIVSSPGQKLSKQNHSQEIYGEDSFALTWLALSILGQDPPQLKQKTQSNLMNWAMTHWDIQKVPKLSEILPDSHIIRY